MGTPTPTDRYHSLDALRAAMMLAVVVLHSAVLFSSVPAGQMVFRFADPDGGPEFFWAAVLLQSVSMPAFFLTAGFFVGMLVAKRGPRAMLAHRLRRITLPFLVFWPVLYGLTMAGIMFGCTVAPEIAVPRADDAGAVLRHVGTATATGTPFPDALTRQWPRPDDTLIRLGTLDGTEAGPTVWGMRGPGANPAQAAWAAVRFVPVGIAVFPRAANYHLIHLWFLWVLTLLVLAAATLTPLAARVPTAWLGRHLDSFAFPLLAAIPLAGAFAWHHFPILPPPPKLGVPIPTVLAYGMFFGTGALMWRHRDRLPAVGRRWPVHLLMGVATWSAACVLTPMADWANASPGPDADVARVGMCFCAAVGHWQLVWACVGAFNRYAPGEFRCIRYVSDASYWVYLVHLPIVLWVEAALLPWPVGRYVKFPIVLACGVGLPLLIYQTLVRGRIVGRFLNGCPSPFSADPHDGRDCSKRPKTPISPGLSGRIL
ncbi:MAG TPA: acyltransferase family protein [Urbifossiella sp.]|jgi:hypothetical protein|nr:acyltransferase family protein [Urbifossiella sp.]